MPDYSWSKLDKIAAELCHRAATGRTITLTPETAGIIGREIMPRHGSDLYLDPFSTGSAIYAKNYKGEDDELVAWAKNTSVGRGAFAVLMREYPEREFIMRRGSWIESDTKEEKIRTERQKEAEEIKAAKAIRHGRTRPDEPSKG